MKLNVVPGPYFYNHQTTSLNSKKYQYWIFCQRDYLFGTHQNQSESSVITKILSFVKPLDLQDDKQSPYAICTNITLFFCVQQIILINNFRTFTIS